MEEPNPYAAPQSNTLLEHPDAVRVRMEFLRAESHLKAFGLLIMVLSLGMITSRLIMWHLLSREFGMSVIPWPSILLGSLPFIVGLGLYFLKRWAGILAVVMSFLIIAINIVNLPGGLVEIIIQAVILRFLLSAGSRRVLSRDYQDMIRRTPMVESRAAAWIRPVIVLLALGFAALFFWR